jgi:integrase
MQELDLTIELYAKVVEWMQPRYSINTVEKYSNILKAISKQYKVLNQDTLRKMAKKMKHQNQRSVLCVINNYCFEVGIDFSIVIPKIKAPPKKLPEILSPSEIKLMVNAAPKPYDLCIRCIFNMGAGLRISEIIKFSWNHIRWIDWLDNKDKYGVAVIKSGKGSKDRMVNIPKNLMHDLYKYAQECNVLNEFKIPVGGSIFTFGGGDYDPKLKAYDLNQWKHEYVKSKYNWFRYHVLQLYCEKALNKHIKVHSLRHSKATYLYEVEKVPVEKIQVLLGHASLNTTMLYTKINPTSVFELIKDTNEI